MAEPEHAAPGSAPDPAWTRVGCALAGAAVLAWWLPTAWLDWQPALLGREPWRVWTAALVHWSPLHLAANLLGLVLVVALGRAAGSDRRVTLAWLLAWPCTQLALLLRPEVAHYGGLSGLLHAGVATAATALLLRARGRRRGIGAALLGGLALKVLLEKPWGPALVQGGGWDIAVVPLVHAAGAVAGVLCALLLLLWPRRPPRPSWPPAQR